MTRRKSAFDRSMQKVMHFSRIRYFFALLPNKSVSMDEGTKRQ
jgi:hypothetical protein